MSRKFRVKIEPDIIVTAVDPADAAMAQSLEKQLSDSIAQDVEALERMFDSFVNGETVPIPAFLSEERKNIITNIVLQQRQISSKVQ